jgi:Xaa-Pro aminopeptidase
MARSGTVKASKSPEEIAAEKEAARLKAEEAAEFTRKTTPGVKLTTERKARKKRGRPSLLGGGGELAETLG